MSIPWVARAFSSASTVGTLIFISTGDDGYFLLVLHFSCLRSRYHSTTMTLSFNFTLRSISQNGCLLPRSVFQPAHSMSPATCLPAVSHLGPYYAPNPLCATPHLSTDPSKIDVINRVCPTFSLRPSLSPVLNPARPDLPLSTLIPSPPPSSSSPVAARPSPAPSTPHFSSPHSSPPSRANSSSAPPTDPATRRPARPEIPRESRAA